MAISLWKLVLILVIIFVMFGAGKLPRVMGDLGKGIRNLRDGLSGADQPEKVANAKDVTPAATPSTEA